MGTFWIIFTLAKIPLNVLSVIDCIIHIIYQSQTYIFSLWATNDFRNIPTWLYCPFSSFCQRLSSISYLHSSLLSIAWRREWQLAPFFMPGESHGQRSLAGYRPWGCKESDITEWLTFAFHSFHSDQSWNAISSSG